MLSFAFGFSAWGIGPPGIIAAVLLLASLLGVAYLYASRGWLGRLLSDATETVPTTDAASAPSVMATHLSAAFVPWLLLSGGPLLLVAFAWGPIPALAALGFGALALAVPMETSVAAIARRNAHLPFGAIVARVVGPRIAFAFGVILGIQVIGFAAHFVYEIGLVLALAPLAVPTILALIAAGAGVSVLTRRFRLDATVVSVVALVMVVGTLVLADKSLSVESLSPSRWSADGDAVENYLVASRNKQAAHDAQLAFDEVLANGMTQQQASEVYSVTAERSRHKLLHSSQFRRTEMIAFDARFWSWVLMFIVGAGAMVPMGALRRPRDIVVSWGLLGLCLVGVLMLLTRWIGEEFAPTTVPPPKSALSSFWLALAMAAGAMSGFGVWISGVATGPQLTQPEDARPAAAGGLVAMLSLGAVVLVALFMDTAQGGPAARMIGEAWETPRQYVLAPWLWMIGLQEVLGELGLSGAGANALLAVLGVGMGMAALDALLRVGGAVVDMLAVACGSSPMKEPAIGRVVTLVLVVLSFASCVMPPWNHTGYLPPVYQSWPAALAAHLTLGSLAAMMLAIYQFRARRPCGVLLLIAYGGGLLGLGGLLTVAAANFPNVSAMALPLLYFLSALVVLAEGTRLVVGKRPRFLPHGVR